MTLKNDTKNFVLVILLLATSLILTICTCFSQEVSEADFNEAQENETLYTGGRFVDTLDAKLLYPSLKDKLKNAVEDTGETVEDSAISLWYIGAEAEQYAGMRYLVKTSDGKYHSYDVITPWIAPVSQALQFNGTDLWDLGYTVQDLLASNFYVDGNTIRSA